MLSRVVNAIGLIIIAVIAIWAVSTNLKSLSEPADKLAGRQELEKSGPKNPKFDALKLRQDRDAAFKTGDWVKVQKISQTLVDWSDDDGESWFLLAYSLHKQGDFEQAIRFNDVAVQFRNYTESALFNKACEFAQLKRNEEAFADLRTLLAIQSSDHDWLAEMKKDEDLIELRKTPEFKDFYQRSLQEYRSK